MLLRNNITQAHHRIKENWERTQSNVRDRLHQIEHRVEETLNHVAPSVQGYLASLGTTTGTGNDIGNSGGSSSSHIPAGTAGPRPTLPADVLVRSGSDLLSGATATPP